MAKMSDSEVKEELREVSTVLLDVGKNMELAQKHFRKAIESLEHADRRIKRIVNYSDLTVESD